MDIGFYKTNQQATRPSAERDTFLFRDATICHSVVTWRNLVTMTCASQYSKTRLLIRYSRCLNPVKLPSLFPQTTQRRRKKKRRMAQLQRRNPMKKKGKSWCVVFDLYVTFALRQVHKSEEDLQLKGELEMLVERLKVCTVSSFHLLD